MLTHWLTLVNNVRTISDLSRGGMSIVPAIPAFSATCGPRFLDVQLGWECNSRANFPKGGHPPPWHSSCIEARVAWDSSPHDPDVTLDRGPHHARPVPGIGQGPEPPGVVMPPHSQPPGVSRPQAWFLQDARAWHSPCGVTSWRSMQDWCQIVGMDRGTHPPHGTQLARPSSMAHTLHNWINWHPSSLGSRVPRSRVPSVTSP
jgi:hypothetical protein